jgi:peptide/nickel transport system permease protein
MSLRRFWPCLFLGALALPELPLDPFRAGLPGGWGHPLGTDALGRGAVLRLLLATARSLGFASSVALGSLATALLLALGEHRLVEARSAIRNLPALLLLIPLATLAGDLSWASLGLLLAGIQGLHLEAPLRRRLDPVRLGPAWASDRLLGLGAHRRLRKWSGWALGQAGPLFPSAWIGALWGEATLRLLGLGPGPHRDSLGLLLQEELPRLSTDPTPLGWAALALVLVLAWLSTQEPP